jgi:hypothetical protein
LELGGVLGFMAHCGRAKVAAMGMALYSRAAHAGTGQAPSGLRVIGTDSHHVADRAWHGAL